MSHRVGKCSACGAKFKVPASFPAERAKCKACGGIVEIGPVVEATPAKGADTGRPKGAAGRGTPVRSAPAQGSTAGGVARGRAKAAAGASAGAPKKREGPSMKEQLLARRRAAAAAAKGSASAGREARAGAAPAKAGATRPARTPKGAAQAAGAHGRAASSRASTRSGARARARTTAGDEGETRATRRGRTARSLAHQREKQSPLVPLIALVLVVVAAGAAWWFWNSMDQQATMPEGGGEATAEVAGTEQAPPGDEPISIEEGNRAIGAEETPAGDTSQAEDAAAAEATGAEKHPEPTKAVDPDSVDLMALPDFGPADDTSEEEWTEIKQLVATFFDPDSGVAASRARIRLRELERKAFPAILNAMKRLDFSTVEGYRNGDVAQRLLMEICNGRNFGWKYSTEPKDVYYNKKVVVSWAKQWQKAEHDMDYWLAMTKQKDKKPAEEDSGEDLGVSEEDLDALDDF